MNRIGRAVGLGGMFVAAALTTSVAPAWAKTEFLTYDGKNAIQEGQGGDKKIVDGIEFWMDGTPPHRYQILGAITDERWNVGIIGAIQMSSFDKDIAKRAREAGGDAVLLADEHNNVVGTLGSSFGSASGSRTGVFGGAWGYSSALTKQASRFVVVKYLPDLPAPPTAQEPPH